MLSTVKVTDGNKSCDWLPVSWEGHRHTSQLFLPFFCSPQRWSQPPAEDSTSSNLARSSNRATRLTRGRYRRVQHNCWICKEQSRDRFPPVAGLNSRNRVLHENSSPVFGVAKSTWAHRLGTARLNVQSMKVCCPALLSAIVVTVIPN